MPIDLNKKQEATMYYYSDDNSNTFGPFTKEELLPKIKKNTLVYYEGISWTNAENIQELKSYFAAQNSQAAPPQKEATIQSAEQGVKKNLFAAPYSFDGRIRRTEYGISLIIYLLVNSYFVNKVDKSIFLNIIYIGTVWFILAQGAKRCHDRGNSGWYQLIPFYALWMLFAEGDNHDNQYGSSPK